MGAFIAVIAASIGLVVLVVGLSLLVLKEGYGYKHKIDPLPEDIEEGKEKIDS